MKSIAEAPSKTIITGEHFVVHGAWALAAALPKKVRVEVSKSASYKVVSDRFTNAGSPELRPIGMVVEAMAREFSVDPKVKVTVSSEVPQGAGLGSSASTMVAVASAFSRLHSLGLGVDEIVDCAMVGEQGIHGKPSGIDPAVCAHGGVILFRARSKLRKIQIQGKRSLIISFSGNKRSTKGQIGKVSRTKEGYPETFRALSDGVSELSLQASQLLQAGDMKGLGRVLSLNQGILSSIGVSTEVLDEMVESLVSLGSYGSKLTGAGGGGSVLAVAPEAKEKSIVSGLSARGFETFRAKVPVEGVKSWLER